VNGESHTWVTIPMRLSATSSPCEVDSDSSDDATTCPQLAMDRSLLGIHMMKKLALMSTLEVQAPIRYVKWSQMLAERRLEKIVGRSFVYYRVASSHRAIATQHLQHFLSTWPDRCSLRRRRRSAGRTWRISTSPHLYFHLALATRIGAGGHRRDLVLLT
jgi:hypothetical protein